MEDTKKIQIVTSDGNVDTVNLVTYLINESGDKKYIVYSKDEGYGSSGDKIIYISSLHTDNNMLTVQEIVDDNEWNEVQKLLRKIANAI